MHSLWSCFLLPSLTRALSILTSDFSSLFCASICVTISFMLVSNTIPPSRFLQEYCEPCLHRKLNPVHRYLQKRVSKVSKIPELYLKCQVSLMICCCIFTVQLVELGEFPCVWSGHPRWLFSSLSTLSSVNRCLLHLHSTYNRLFYVLVLAAASDFLCWDQNISTLIA